MMILDLLLHSQQERPFLVSKILGVFFLMLGGVTGIFFLFQALNPLLGYLESGIIVCALLTVFGGGLLFIGPRKKVSPQEEMTEKAVSFFKDLKVEKMLQDNALIISLLALGGGLILSQLKNVKHLPEINKFFK